MKWEVKGAYSDYPALLSLFLMHSQQTIVHAFIHVWVTLPWNDEKGYNKNMIGLHWYNKKENKMLGFFFFFTVVHHIQ